MIVKYVCPSLADAGSMIELRPSVLGLCRSGYSERTRDGLQNESRRCPRARMRSSVVTRLCRSSNIVRSTATGETTDDGSSKRAGRLLWNLHPNQERIFFFFTESISAIDAIRTFDRSELAPVARHGQEMNIVCH